MEIKLALAVSVNSEARVYSTRAFACRRGASGSAGSYLLEFLIEDLFIAFSFQAVFFYFIVEETRVEEKS